MLSRETNTDEIKKKLKKAVCEATIQRCDLSFWNLRFDLGGLSH